MTEERMALIELVEKQAGSDLVRDMLAFAAERIMEAEVEARTGAAKGTQRPNRTTATSKPPAADPVSSDRHPPAAPER